MERKLLFKKLPKMIHGGDYNPDQWLDYPGVMEKDIEMMKKAHINCVTLGVFSWSTYEKTEGNYDFSWLLKTIDTLYENGIYTILATPSGARPAWMDLKYEEVRRVDKYGNREYRRERHNHCMSSPIYRQKVYEMDRRLAEAVKDKESVILWHLSNEFEGYCYCDLCKKKFQKYLKNRYKTIDKLNHEYWTGFWSKYFNDFDEIEPPYENGENALMGLLLDWRRFSSENVVDFMKREKEAVLSVRDDIPVTTNMMMFFPQYDYRLFAKELDVLCWDAYPQFHNSYESLFDTFQEAGFTHTLLRSMKKQPFMLMESTPSLVNWRDYNKLKKPGVHELSCMQTIANGSDSIQYFQIRKSRGAFEMFHGALIDHNGRDDTRVFKEVESVGEKLENLEEVIGSNINAKTAIMVDWDNRWALWGAKAFHDSDKGYEKEVRELYKALIRKGIEVDIIASDDDLDEYEVVFAPMLFVLKPGVSESMKKFVERGGILVAGYMLGYVNENQLAYLGGFPGDGLMELFGLEAEEIDTLWPGQTNGIDFKNQRSDVFDYAEILNVKDAKVLGTYTDDFYKDMPAFTLKEYGKGKAYYLGGRINNNDLVAKLYGEFSNKGIKIYDLPYGIERHTREYGDKKFIFYLNETDEMKEIVVEEGIDMLSGEAAGGQLTLKPYQSVIIKEVKHDC